MQIAFYGTALLFAFLAGRKSRELERLNHFNSQVHTRSEDLTQKTGDAAYLTLIGVITSLAFFAAGVATSLLG